MIEEIFTACSIYKMELLTYLLNAKNRDSLKNAVDRLNRTCEKWAVDIDDARIIARNEESRRLKKLREELNEWD